MRVLVTGAAGWIGSGVVPHLLDAGHDVTALVRPGSSAEPPAGARIVRCDIADPDGLRRAAATADGVIHLAYFHRFTQPGLGTRLRVLLGGAPGGIVQRFAAAGAAVDLRAIETFGDVLAASGGPLVVALPTFTVVSGKRTTEPATEKDDPVPTSLGAARIPSERATLALAGRGVRASVVRIPPTVHGIGDHGLIHQLVGIARKNKESGYVGHGDTRWSAVHRDDAARLFRLALDHGAAGSRYHAVAEEGLEFADIAKAIGHGLDVPVRSAQPGRFGWLGAFVGADNYVSSALTRDELGWRPTGPGLLADLAGPSYF